MPTYRFCASPRSHVLAPHVDCAGMPWGHRRCPSTAAASTEAHRAGGGCCVVRRLIVVCFAGPRRQRRTPRRPRRSPGARRCRTTPGRARRRRRRGWLLCCWWRPASKTENQDPALQSTNRDRQRFACRPLSPLAAVGHGAAGFRRRQGRGGGAIRPCRLIFILAVWPVALVLFAGCLGFGKGAANASDWMKSVSHRGPGFGWHHVVL